MLIRRKITNLNDEYHHEDLLGNFGVITGANGSVLGSRVYDMFNVIRNTIGGSLTPYVHLELMMGNESMLVHEGVQYYPSRSVTISVQAKKPWKKRRSVKRNPDPLKDCQRRCYRKFMYRIKKYCDHMPTRQEWAYCWSMMMEQHYAPCMKTCRNTYDPAPPVAVPVMPFEPISTPDLPGWPVLTPIADPIPVFAF